MPETSTTDYDVIIAGGGISGLALACSLRNTGLRIGVVDQREPQAFTEDYALRVSAINRASLQVFQRHPPEE